MCKELKRKKKFSNGKNMLFCGGKNVSYRYIQLCIFFVYVHSTSSLINFNTYRYFVFGYEFFLNVFLAVFFSLKLVNYLRINKKKKIVYKLKKYKSFIKTIQNTFISNPSVSGEVLPFSIVKIFQKRKKKVALSKICKYFYYRQLYRW